MKTLEVDNRGNVGMVMTLVTTTIVLMVASIVIGSLTAMSTTLGLTGASLAMFQNISAMAYMGTNLCALSLIVLGAYSILGYFGIGGGGRK